MTYLMNLSMCVQAHGLGVLIPVVAGDVVRTSVRGWKTRSRKRQRYAGLELDLAREHFFSKLSRCYGRYS